MRNNNIFTALGIVLVLGIGFLVYSQNKDEVTQEALPSSQSTSTSEVVASPGITLAEVGIHNSRESCWSVINSFVYDLTSWIPNHPGGEERILGICGIDGSSMFNTNHGTAKKPLSILMGFKVGALAQ